MEPSRYRHLGLLEARVDMDDKVDYDQGGLT